MSDEPNASIGEGIAEALAKAVPEIIKLVIDGGAIALAALVVILLCGTLVPLLKGTSGLTKLIGFFLATVSALLLAGLFFLSENGVVLLNSQQILEKFGMGYRSVAPSNVSNTQITKRFQEELTRHNCEPGAIDGIYGRETIEAAIVYSSMSQGQCTDIGSPPAAGSSGSEVWRNILHSSANALAACKKAICGDPLGDGYRRAKPTGCVVANPFGPNASRPSWIGACDENGFATGDGEVRWVTASRDGPLVILGQMDGGFLRTGTSTYKTSSGTEYTYQGEFSQYEWHGEGTLFLGGGKKEVSGNWDRGRIEYGKIVNKLSEEYSTVYEGGISPKFTRHGEGRLFWQDPVEVITGVWINDDLTNGQIEYPNCSPVCSYVGPLKELHPYGYGTIYYEDGRVVNKEFN